MTPARKFCHRKDTQEITSLADSVYTDDIPESTNEDYRTAWQYFKERSLNSSNS